MTVPIATYQQRRQQLLNVLPMHSVAFVHSGNEQIRNRDTHYPFRPHSDFYYLTGFYEPNSLLVLIKTPDCTRVELCLRAKDKEKEIWDGFRLGVDAAPTQLGVDNAYDIAQLDTLLGDWLAQKIHLFVSFEQHPDWFTKLLYVVQQLKRKVRQGISTPTSMNDLDPLLHEQRLIKDITAQSGLRQAAQITVAGHLAAMTAAKTARFEYQIQAALEAGFKNAGAHLTAFNSIVASGRNACVLHYNENNCALNQGELVLIDAGAEYDGYAGDCTHTFPISGRFTNEQAAIYTVVLAAQQAALAQIKPGIPYDAPHQAAVNVIAQGLIDLGLLSGTLDSVIASGSYKTFYMHQTGHWLGCDVHDVGQYKIQGAWRPLLPGMALTVEPGIYIAPDHELVDARWRGIGIRIEDSVLVTETGYECLTAGLPRTIAEIEAWMDQA